MVDRFPAVPYEAVRHRGQDRNPAIQLFGRRFFSDQTTTELLVELLLLAMSEKQIGDKKCSSTQGGVIQTDVFPAVELLKNWQQGAPLEYAVKARLNLKMFSFLGASRIDTRHKTHREHYRELLKQLSQGERLSVSSGTDRNEILRTLENLFLGFQGVGENRTWCAQTFLPITTEILAGESIWRETRARIDNVSSWMDALSYFSHTQQIFLARGGELLYLQICNVLRQEEAKLERWSNDIGLGLLPREYVPVQLRNALGSALVSILKSCPQTVGQLASFIDTGVDARTAAHTDTPNGKTRFMACGWCPGESWPEGLLFAVELLRVCEATMDPIERLELLEIACALQLLRSLCTQSARHAPLAGNKVKSLNPFGFVWALSDPEGQHIVAKQISRRCVNAIERLIHDAIRIPEILVTVRAQKQDDERHGRPWKDPYREADSGYGHKLFITVAKRIGLIVPKRGAGARFVLNDKLLRYLVIALIRPGERMTYETFKQLLFAHYGIAVDDTMLGIACEWCGTKRLSTIGGATDVWMIQMLDAAGMLLKLSDSCSLVCNPFGDGGNDR
jgi:hypothetical protein